MASGPTFFATPAEFRDWLEQHHADEDELYVGFYKKATGKPGMTWAESVDEALCFGWIDGRRNGIDEESSMIRFTPRRKRSIWSKRNVERMAALDAEGRVRPAGRKAFEARSEDRSGVYSFERGEDAKLEPAQEKRFRADADAWEFFQAQPPGYRRTALHLVVSAKRPETRERRLDQLIADSAAGRRLKQLTRPARKG
jgi:uncharacterized protein YdeI (YjbR/CyaY-like superfamily)